MTLVSVQVSCERKLARVRARAQVPVLQSCPRGGVTLAECGKAERGFTGLAVRGGVQERRARGGEGGPGPGPRPILYSRPGLAGSRAGPRPAEGAGGQTKAQLAVPLAPRSGARGPGAGPGAPGGAVRGRGQAPGAGRAASGAGQGGAGGGRRWGWRGRERAALSRGLRRPASGQLRADAERARERSGPAMGRRAAGALLLALLLHGRLLGVSVRAEGRGVGGRPGPARCARQLGGGAEAALWELWFRTRRRSGTPGWAQAGRHRPAPPSRVGLSRGPPREPCGAGGGASRVGARGSPSHVVESPSRAGLGSAFRSWGPGRGTFEQGGNLAGQGTAPLSVPASKGGTPRR